MKQIFILNELTHLMNWFWYQNVKNLICCIIALKNVSYLPFKELLRWHLFSSFSLCPPSLGDKWPSPRSGPTLHGQFSLVSCCRYSAVTFAGNVPKWYFKVFYFQMEVETHLSLFHSPPVYKRAEVHWEEDDVGGEHSHHVVSAQLKSTNCDLSECYDVKRLLTSSATFDWSVPYLVSTAGLATAWMLLKVL